MDEREFDYYMNNICSFIMTKQMKSAEKEIALFKKSVLDSESKSKE